MSTNDDRRKDHISPHKYEIGKFNLMNNTDGLVIVTCKGSKIRFKTTIDRICETIIDDFPSQERTILRDLCAVL